MIAPSQTRGRMDDERQLQFSSSSSNKNIASFFSNKYEVFLGIDE
jgi:hypothetical protein